MDRKQPLLLVLMITLLGIAIASAIWVFTERNIQVRRDEMVVDIQRIAADAQQFRRRPATMGGGGGSYLPYEIPAAIRSLPYAEYTVSAATSADTLFILAEGSKNIGTILAGIDPQGAVRIVRVTGEFAD